MCEQLNVKLPVRIQETLFYCSCFSQCSFPGMPILWDDNKSAGIFRPAESWHCRS